MVWVVGGRVGGVSISPRNIPAAPCSCCCCCCVCVGKSYLINLLLNFPAIPLIFHETKYLRLPFTYTQSHEATGHTTWMIDILSKRFPRTTAAAAAKNAYTQQFK